MSGRGGITWKVVACALWAVLLGIVSYVGDSLRTEIKENAAEIKRVDDKANQILALAEAIKGMDGRLQRIERYFDNRAK